MDAWYNNPIELSENNESTSGVTYTFNFACTTAITMGSMSITFPTGYSSHTTTTFATSLVVGTNSVDVTAVTNPTSPGGYGPFKLVTRNVANGQIIDANYAFGSVGIAATAGSISNLSLVYASNSANTINLTSQSVNFTFTISRDLWKHDMFVIVFDSKFTVASGVTCTSYRTGTDINFYNTTTAGAHALNCEASA